MHDWAASLGIAAITPELLSGDLSELEQNIAGVQAVLASAEQLLPLPQPVKVDGLLVDALIWRYWRSHGGAETFGPPISPAIVFDDHTEQYFEQALLELWPARMRSFEGFVVSEGGRERWSRQLLNAPQSPYQPR